MPTEIQTWSNTFCPSVLSSASEASDSSPSSTSSSAFANPVSTNSYTSSSTSSALPVAAGSPASASASASPSTTSTASPTLASFGAGTHGTTWGELPTNPSKANRGPAFEAVSIILLSVAALVLAFRCAHVRFGHKTSIADLRQSFRTDLHQDYKTSYPGSGSRWVVRAHYIGTYMAFC